MINAKEARNLMPSTKKKNDYIEQKLFEFDKQIAIAAEKDENKIIVDLPNYDIAIENILIDFGFTIKIINEYGRMIIAW